MQPQAPDVSVILVSWNTRALLLDCLAALPAALGDLSSEVRVVDNASTDSTVAAIRASFPAVQIIENRSNVGFAAANNQAIVRSSGRYVLLLNSDTIPSPRSIERLVHVADAHPRAAMVGPMLRNPDGTFQGSFTTFPNLCNELLNVTGLGKRLIGPWYPNYGPRQSRHARQVAVIQGACMLVRQAAIRDVGMLDEAYFMYSEETDWCRRFYRAGWELWYEPTAQICHYGGQSTRQMPEAMVRALYRSKVRYFRKHHGPLPATILQAAFVAARRCRQIVRQARAMRLPTPNAEPPLRWSDLDSRS